MPQFIPSIEADSDDDDSSDGELPIFFTSTEPGAPSSSAARHGADSASSGATHTARAAPVHRDEGDELAAFERAASEALRREEERSARIVAAHLAPDEHRHPPDDDDPFDDSDSDSDSDSDATRGSVRARPRRAPRPATARRAPTTPPPTNVADAVSSLFDGWLSGAAGRLASGVRSTTEGRLDSAAGDPPAVSSSFDTVAYVEREFASRATLDADGNLPGAVRANMPRPSVSLNLDGSLGGVDLDALLARLQTPEGLAEVESGRAGGEVDGDWDGDGDAVRADDVAFGLVDDDDRYDRYDGGVPGMVPAAATAAARAEAASSSARTTANGAVAASSLVGGRGGGWGGAGRYESDEGWAREHARVRGRGSRPRSAFVAASVAAPVTRSPVRGAGAPRERTPATDPYGRGNARLRSARRSNAPAPVTSLGGPGPRARATDDDGESPSGLASTPNGFVPRGTRIDPAAAIRIDARGTADPAADETDGGVDEEMEEWRRFRQTRARPESAPASRRRTPTTVTTTVTTSVTTSVAAPPSPGAAAADEAAAAAMSAAASAKAAATRANAEAAAREESSRRGVADSSARRRGRLDFSSEVSSDGGVKAAGAGRGFGPGREGDGAGSARERETNPEMEAEMEAERASREAAAESARSEGAASFRRGDYAAAIDAYTRALEASPTPDATSLAVRSAAHLRRGDAAAAEADATAALAADPKNPADALRRRADARTAAGDLRGALADLEALHVNTAGADEEVVAALADARRSVAHAEGATLVEMDRHDAERARLAAAREAAWEAKRAAGLREHGLRAASARASRRASETGKR